VWKTRWYLPGGPICADSQCSHPWYAPSPALCAQRSDSSEERIEQWSTATTEAGAAHWLANEFGESDVAEIYLGHRVGEHLQTVNLVLQSCDTDVWIAALAQIRPTSNPYVGFTARNGTVAVHRPASDEYVDIVETAAVVAELGITVAEFCFVFALAGSDFTSGIAGFSHTSIVKMYQANHAWITDNKRDPLAQVGTDGQLTFSMEGWRRLALTLYYERSKGGQNGVNYIVPGGDQNRGRTLAALYTAQGMDAAYRTVRTTVHEHTGKESRALASWGAMLRHAARAFWVAKYHAGTLHDRAATDAVTTVHTPAPCEPTAEVETGVSGWVRAAVDGALRICWDEGVVEPDPAEVSAGKKVKQKGCGCKGGATKGPCAGGCGCRRKGVDGTGMRCGAYCACSGGPRCANPKNAADPEQPGAFAAGSGVSLGVDAAVLGGSSGATAEEEEEEGEDVENTQLDDEGDESDADGEGQGWDSDEEMETVEAGRGVIDLEETEVLEESVLGQLVEVTHEDETPAHEESDDESDEAGHVFFGD